MSEVHRGLAWFEKRLIILILVNAALFAVAAYRIHLDGWPNHVPWLFLFLLTTVNLNLGFNLFRDRKRLNRT